MPDREPYELLYTAEEIDRKLQNVPLDIETNPVWTRNIAWTQIADQRYNSDSAFAQSGKAVAEAVAEVVAGAVDTIPTITDEEIVAVFSDSNS